MPTATIDELFELYKEPFENIDRLLTFDTDENLVEWIFTELDTDLSSFWFPGTPGTLQRLYDANKITQEVRQLSEAVYNHYIEMHNKGKWEVEEYKAKSPAWVKLFSDIKQIQSLL